MKTYALDRQPLICVDASAVKMAMTRFTAALLARSVARQAMLVAAQNSLAYVRKL